MPNPSTIDDTIISDCLKPLLEMVLAKSIKRSDVADANIGAGDYWLNFVDVNGNLILGGYHSSTFTLDGNILSGSGVSQGLLIKTNPSINGVPM